jgi:hypothetical protein
MARRAVRRGHLHGGDRALASETLSPDEKVEVTARSSSAPRRRGRAADGLQLICLDNLGAGGGPGAVRRPHPVIFESMPASLSELVLAGRRTSSWTIPRPPRHQDLPPGRSPTEQGAPGNWARGGPRLRALLRGRRGRLPAHEHSLYRVILTKRLSQDWAVTVPCDIPPPGGGPAWRPRSAPTMTCPIVLPAAVGPMIPGHVGGRRTRADSSGPSSETSSRPGAARHRPGGRSTSAAAGLEPPLTAAAHRVTAATGLTLSRAQLGYLTQHPVPGRHPAGGLNPRPGRALRRSSLGH